MKSSDIVDMLKLGRFHFLFGGLLLYLLGVQIAVVSGWKVGFWETFFGYLVLALGHLSVSYSNDYFDYRSDGFGEPTMVSGGSGVLQRRPELRRWSLLISLLLIALSLMAGLVFYILYSPGYLFIALVIFGNLLGWFYSAPPLKLAYRKLGEVATALAVGIFVSLFGYYVAAGTVDLDFLIFAPPLLLSGVVFILNVQIPDVEADRRGGKSTLVSRIGRKKAFTAITILQFLSVLYFLTISFAKPVELKMSFVIIGIIAMIPVTASVPYVISKVEGKRAFTKLSTLLLGSTFIYLISLNGYLMSIWAW